MKQILFGAGLIGALALGACGGIAERPNAAPAPPVNATMPALGASSSTTDSAATAAAAQANAQTGAGAQTPASIPGSAPSGAAVASGLNPPHGQPGHTCAIPVGAPLSSAPAAGSATTGATAPSTPITIEPSSASAPATSTMPSVSVTPSTSTTPAAPPSGGAMSGTINPPHGQPGHSCATPVGQPLP